MNRNHETASHRDVQRDKLNLILVVNDPICLFEG